MVKTTNVLVRTFDGLALPPTITLPIPSSDPISSIFDSLEDLLPSIKTSLLLSTVSGKVLQPHSTDPVTSISANDDFVTLRLHLPLCGGKGGFGSQLRAAGGRMSSRKRKGQENNDSCRNLDGRRMRTIKEAKALAAYLEIKPEMDQKEKETRRERWEKVVENAEDKIKGGGKGGSARFDDSEWLDQKEESRDKTREAVLKAMKLTGGVVPTRPGLPESGASSSSSISDDSQSSDDEVERAGGSKDTSPEVDAKPVPPKTSRPVYLGFDEDDDEFMSSSDEEDEGAMEDVTEREEETEETSFGKGKARAN